MNKPPVFKKQFLCLVLGMAGSLSFAEDWYISNAGGMALEPAFSRLALRNKYALSVENSSSGDVPERLLKYYNITNRYLQRENEPPELPFRVELRCLYKEGELSRRQWSFRDEKNLTRMVAVLNADKSGFIEVFNAGGLITEARQLAQDGTEYITRYIYNDTFLIRAMTSLFTPPPPPGEAELPAEDEAPGAAPAVSAPGVSGNSDIETVPVPVAITPPALSPGEDGGFTEELWTDYYRYTRSYALRGVERRFHRTPPVLPAPVSEGSSGDSPGELLADEQAPVFLKFPQLILGVGGENEFVQPGSAFSSEFFEDVIINSGDRIIYTTDERGRILSEIRRDSSDTVLGEVQNTWAGDRLTSVLWKSNAEERFIEYEYDQSGDRIFERNFRNGVLERTVRREGEREVEELYMNGAVILRAIWEDGRKLSEERVRPDSSRREQVRPESSPAGSGEASRREGE